MVGTSSENRDKIRRHIKGRLVPLVISTRRQLHILMVATHISPPPVAADS